MLPPGVLLVPDTSLGGPPPPPVACTVALDWSNFDAGQKEHWLAVHKGPGLGSSPLADLRGRVLVSKTLGMASAGGIPLLSHYQLPIIYRALCDAASAALAEEVAVRSRPDGVPSRGAAHLDTSDCKEALAALEAEAGTAARWYVLPGWRGDDWEDWAPAAWGSAPYLPLRERPEAVPLGVDAAYPTWTLAAEVAGGGSDTLPLPGGVPKPDQKRSIVLRHVCDALRGKPPALDHNVDRSASLARVAAEAGAGTALDLALSFGLLVAKRRRLRVLLLPHLSPSVGKMLGSSGERAVGGLDTAVLARWMVGLPHDAPRVHIVKGGAADALATEVAMAHAATVCRAAAASALAPPARCMLVGLQSAKAEKAAPVPSSFLKTVAAGCSLPEVLPRLLAPLVGRRLLEAYAPIYDDLALVSSLQHCGYGTLLLAPATRVAAGASAGNFWTSLLQPVDWIREVVVAEARATVLIAEATVGSTDGPSASASNSSCRYRPDKFCNAGPARDAVDARLEILAWAVSAVDFQDPVAAGSPSSTR